MGVDQRENERRRMLVIDSVRGHAHSMVHAHNHTDGHCPKCGCDKFHRFFCVGERQSDPPLPRLPGCEVDGEHVHLMCGACKYPMIERCLDQAMLSESEGNLPVESEMAAVLAALVQSHGGIQLSLEKVYTFRTNVMVHFERDQEADTITLSLVDVPEQTGKPRHPTREMLDESTG